MTASISPSIDHLELTWQSLDALLASLDEGQWKAPTGCPGWSVQDNVTHLIDYESRALGRAAPDHTPGDVSHTKNKLGESNEIGIDARRSLAPGQVIAEYRDVTAARLAQLRALGPDDLAREVTTPAGPGTVADMLTLRVMDTWSHEQDIRRAVGKPGHESGPVVDETVRYFARFLPLLCGKRAGVPDGASVLFDLPPVDRFGIEVHDGRAAPTATPPASPTVTLTMPATTFAALACGRDDAPDDYTITGDTALGVQIIGVLGFMP
jgi:uncharacterized protein (TIGR03083 family)